jgi:hypothetical protein
MCGSDDCSYYLKLLEEKTMETIECCATPCKNKKCEFNKTVLKNYRKWKLSKSYCHVVQSMVDIMKYKIK